MSKLMADTMTKEDWERQEKGLAPLPKPEKKMPVYEPPLVQNRIDAKEIKMDKFVQYWGKQKGKRNTEGVMFIGYDVEILFEEGERISGWMSEVDFLEFQRQIRGKNKVQVTKYIPTEVSSDVPEEIKEEKPKRKYVLKHRPKRPRARPRRKIDLVASTQDEVAENVPEMVSNG